MPIRTCPHCARRLPYAGRRCIHCGWTIGGDHPRNGGVRWWRRARAIAVAGVTVGLVAVQFAFRNADDLADWYAGFAARFLPGAASSFGPVDTGAGAFFYCARQVSKKMEGQYSVETFDERATRTVDLGDHRYRVEAVVDQLPTAGERVRHDFSCTVRFEKGRWVLEDLVVENLAARSSPTRVAAGSSDP